MVRYHLHWARFIKPEGYDPIYVPNIHSKNGWNRSNHVSAIQFLLDKRMKQKMVMSKKQFVGFSFWIDQHWCYSRYPNKQPESGANFEKFSSLSRLFRTLFTPYLARVVLHCSIKIHAESLNWPSRLFRCRE